jgi:hypothetical protein
LKYFSSSNKIGVKSSKEIRPFSILL